MLKVKKLWFFLEKICHKFGFIKSSALSLHSKFLIQLLLIQKGGGKWPDDTLATYTRYKVLHPTLKRDR